MGRANPLPSGDVTFVLSDVEGSTATLRSLGEHRYGDLIDRVRRIHDDAANNCGGVLVATNGDSCLLAFNDPGRATEACGLIQNALATQQPHDAVLVRMGVHRGTGILPRDDNYSALALHQTARVMSAAHGGQVLLTNEVARATGRTRSMGLFRLRDFDEPIRLYAMDLGTDRSVRVPRALRVGSASVPQYRTAFVGRPQVETVLREALQTCRLVSLVGPGGAGKTRLATAAASSDDLGFDAAWFLDLVPARDVATIEGVLRAALVGALAEHDLSDPRRALAEVVRDYPTLLVLDNCEHVIDDAASFVDDLARRCPGLHILCTSREPLALPGERIVTLAGLDLPEAPTADALRNSAAGRLFLDRTAHVTQENLDDRSVADAVELLREIDGLPLAIELVAAMAGAYPVVELRELIRHDLAGGNTGGAVRGRHSRHTSLHSVISWSVSALEPAADLALSALSYAVAPIAMRTARAALSAAGIQPADVDALILTLARRSLVMRDPAGSIRLLESIRIFAAQRHVSALHRAVIHGLAADCLDCLGEPFAPGDRVKEEHLAVVPTALAMLRSSKLWTSTRQRLALALGPWFFSVSAFELEREMAEALQLEGGDPFVVARLHEFCAGALMIQGRYDDARRELDAAGPLLPADTTEPVVQHHFRLRANLALRQGDALAATDIRLAYEGHSSGELYWHWQNVDALAHSVTGDLATAAHLFERLLANSPAPNRVLNLADVYARQGRAAEAFARIVEYLGDEERLHYVGVACQIAVTALTKQLPWTPETYALLLWSVDAMQRQGHATFADELDQLAAQIAHGRAHLDPDELAQAHALAATLDRIGAVALILQLAERM